MSSKDCGHKVPCGCGDQSLTTPPPCNSSGDCAGEPCSELFNQQCIVYTGPNFNTIVGGEDFFVNTGDRLDAIIQKMMIGLTAVPADVATAAYGLRFTNITSTGFTLTWEGDSLTAYRVQTNLLNPVTPGFVDLLAGTFTYTFSNLVSGGEYEIIIEDLANTVYSSSFYITLP